MFSEKYIPLIICISAILSSCGSSQVEERNFPFVKVPSVISSGEEASSYTATYFWDDFTDTSSVFHDDSSHVNGVSTDDLEKAFSDYAVMLDEIGIDKARSAVSRLYSRAEAFEKADTASVLFETLCGLAEKYFYDPNSPFRNIASLDRHRTQSLH